MIENYRKVVVTTALSGEVAKSSLPFWVAEAEKLTGGVRSGRSLFDLGDNLRVLFQSSAQGKIRESGNSNQAVSSGGAAWESLVCWYMNLCLIGTSALVIKSKKELIPNFVRDAIAVKYNNFKSNTEADLILIGFPILEWPEKKEKESFSKYMDRCHESGLFGLSDISVGIIQTKTNWNDNAQIPMLWDMVYSAREFGRNVKVGSNGRSISSFRDFNYAFVTVPTQKDLMKSFKSTSTSVNRVRNLSGGNFWGEKSRDGVADSLKEYFLRNTSSYFPNTDPAGSISSQLEYLNSTYSYFGLTRTNLVTS